MKAAEIYLKVIMDLLSSGILESVGTVEHAIVEGNHFLYYDIETLGNGGVQNYLLTIPDDDNSYHLLLDLSGTAITQFELYEDTDKTGSVLKTTYNSNRNSAKVSAMTVHKGITDGSTDGTLLKIYKGGSATNRSRAASSIGTATEMILKNGSKYILRLTSYTADNITSVRLWWYTT